MSALLGSQLSLLKNESPAKVGVRNKGLTAPWGGSLPNQSPSRIVFYDAIAAGQSEIPGFNTLRSYSWSLFLASAQNYPPATRVLSISQLGALLL